MEIRGPVLLRDAGDRWTLDELTLVGELACPLIGPRRDARDPASAPDRRRLHGLAHPPEGRGAPACLADLAVLRFNTRHDIAAWDERGRLRRRTRRGVRRRRGDGIRHERSFRIRGSWAGRSAPSWH
jgi:hypothetical protein